MSRCTDWQARLDAEFMAARKRAWRWGYHDCVTLGAKCADAVTDGDYALRLQKFIYSDAKTAADIVAGGGLRKLISDELGDPVAWVRCGHGDLVLCEHVDCERAFPEILTVHDGAQLLSAGSKGLVRVQMQYALCGWKI